MTGFRQPQMVHGMVKGKKKQSEETKQVSEPGSDMAGAVKSSDRKLKRGMIHMLRKKVDDTHEPTVYG